jgi:AbrB family transcriptional regulator (stage V sporulation protein T)
MYNYRDGADKIFVTADTDNYFIRCAMPIISNGDIIGCVASLVDVTDDKSKDIPSPEVEAKLVLTAAGFLGRQIET